MTLGLHVIAKDEKDQILRIINDYGQYFDELAFAVDDLKIHDELKERFKDDVKVHFHKYTWCDDFSHKRNWLVERIKSDYYMRLDTDDVIDHPEFIPQAFASYVKNGYTLVFFKYLYGFDDSGVCNALHWRETIIKNDGNIFWNKRIHENTNPKSTRKMVPGKEISIAIIHNATPEARKSSADRNFKFLLEEYNQRKADGKKQDARTIGYIARMYLGTKEYETAIPYFWDFLANSGWEEDKYSAWVQLADCFISLGRFEQAISCCVEALLLKPEFPDAYFFMMGIYFEKKDFKKAIEWGEQGFKKPTPETMYIQDPSSYSWRPAAQIAMCYMQVGQFEKALALLNKAKKIAPKEKSVHDALRQFTEIYNENEAVKNYIRLMHYTKNDLRNFNSLVSSIPRNIVNDERICGLRNMIEPPKKWGKKSVVFFCGGAWEDWVDTSVIGGIGGSEEATIYLAREFVNMGYDVTVFNQCGELEGEYKGVKYVSRFKFNPKDEFNILIAWRYNMFQHKISARKRIIWLHDIPAKDMILDSDMESIDRIIVLSDYHKSYLKHLTDQSKIYVSRNGLNITDFVNIEEERNPHRCIYASSYDRGLEKLLDKVWDKVKLEVPDAELHIFYGWNTYVEMMKQGRRSKEFYAKMMQLMKKPGVFEHGRIGQKKLAKEYFKSGVFAYPSTFEEISCIGAMRAQATGAVPVVNNYAALKETVKFGVKIDGDVAGDNIYDEYANELIRILKDTKLQEDVRKDMMPKAQEMFSWKGVAEAWEKDLF